MIRSLLHIGLALLAISFIDVLITGAGSFPELSPLGKITSVGSTACVVVIAILQFIKLKK